VEPHFPIFVSIVLISRNQEKEIEEILQNSCSFIRELVSDYEFIVVDNASSDESLREFNRLTGSDGMSNLQIYALTKEVDKDTAIWVGLENALGDFVIVFDPQTDDLNILPAMLEKAVSGNDVVFAINERKPGTSAGYRFASHVFNRLYKWFNGIDLEKDAPQYRVLSKRVINFILQHSYPAISYRHLPATAGFLKSYLTYSSVPKLRQTKRLGESIERGIQLMLSTTRAPMRLVTFLSLFGAAANLVYSLYVVLVGLFLENVAPGWISMSLQMSGMFFLISLVLLVLGEYILHMTRLSNDGPQYHVGQEFTSARITRRGKLNIEECTTFAPLVQ